jgi:hypothetical protein
MKMCTENSQVREKTIEYTVFVCVSNSYSSHGLAVAALSAQNLSYATKVVEKQQMLYFKKTFKFKICVFRATIAQRRINHRISSCL